MRVNSRAAVKISAVHIKAAMKPLMLTTLSPHAASNTHGTVYRFVQSLC